MRGDELDPARRPASPAPDEPVDPLDAFVAEDLREEQRDLARREYESHGITIALTEVDGSMVPDDGARLTESERRFWRGCDTERRRQSAPPALPLRVQCARRTCQGSRRPRARRVRRAHAPPGDSSGGDSEPGEPARRTEQHLALPRQSAAARFALAEMERLS